MKAKLELFNYEWALKADCFRMINPIYNYLEDKLQFESTNDSRRMFYARCRFLPEGLLISSKIRSKRSLHYQRSRVEKKQRVRMSDFSFKATHLKPR